MISGDYLELLDNFNVKFPVKGFNVDKIRIKGLRSLVDTGFVDIKPINILVGTNSSGKSTFLRCFPLIRQSVERRTRGPILWNGVYTDFESFITSLHNGLNKNETSFDKIEFGFEFEFLQPNRRVREKDKRLKLTANIQVKEGGSKHSCYTSKYSIKLGEHEINFNFEEGGGIKDVNSSKFNWDLSKRELKFQLTDTDSILPVIKLPEFSFNYLGKNKNAITTTIYNQIKQLIQEYSGSKSELRVNSITGILLSEIRDDVGKLSIMKSIYSTRKWKKNVDGWTSSHHDFGFLSGLIDLFTLMENSYAINSHISQTFKNVRYVAPLRASTERYYRYQDLSVDELDHRGENIGMFLSNIPTQWRKKLDDWTELHFKFKIKEETSSSHIAIRLIYGDYAISDNVSDNIADMGFGFSQILPIVVQLWSIASGYEKTLKSSIGLPVIFAIEQPELHLHPRMQAALSTVFTTSIGLAKENDIDLRLIIETHSSAMISKLGDLIAMENANKDDINVIIFEQDRKLRETKLSYSNFNSNGELEHWPTGFFSY